MSIANTCSIYLLNTLHDSVYFVYSINALDRANVTVRFLTISDSFSILSKFNYKRSICGSRVLRVASCSALRAVYFTAE